MSDNTSCYYQGVLTVADYEDLYAHPVEDYKDDPEGVYPSVCGILLGSHGR